MNINSISGKRARALLLPLATLAWLSFGALPIANAASIMVTADCPLDAAITAANTDSNSHDSDCVAGSGADTINFATANQTVQLTSQLNIQSDITINGNGTTLDGMNTTRILSLSGGSLQLDNITLTKGYASGKGRSGGAIHVSAGTDLTVTNSAFTSNRAGSFGGAIHVAGDVNISNSAFYDNEASVDSIDAAGGAISVMHTTTNNSNLITHVTMLNNKGKSRGTGIRVSSYRSRLSLRNSIITSSGSSLADCYVGDPTSMWQRVGNVIGIGGGRCASNKSNADLDSSTGNPLYFPLKRSSEAIGAGNDAICAAFPTDRVGNARPQTGCDAGAVEHSLNSPVTPTPVSAAAAHTAERSGGSWERLADGTWKWLPDGASADALQRPDCTGEDLNRSGQIRVRAAYGICSGAQFKRLEAGWLTGNRQVEASFIDGVDVFGYAAQGVEVCFPAYGAVVLLDAATSPRTLQPLASYLDGRYTCAAFNKAGMAVLVAADSGLAPPMVGKTLSDCMVTTTHALNLRAGPAGEVIGTVMYKATLTALSRTEGWFEVDANGQRGWISADYVEPRGDFCG